MPDTEHYLNDMRETTLEYARKWNLVALRIGNAYTKAYNRQQTFLDNVKKAIEEARKKEQAMMSFTLGLLTGGIVGPIANRFVAKFTKGGELSILKDAADKVTHDSLLTEWTGETFKELAKAGDSKLRELGIERLYPQSASPANGFQPAGMTPLEYITSLQIGMETRADFMSDTARLFHRTLYSIPAAVAEAMNRSFLSSSFFTALPNADALNEASLQRSAALMLWIGWAKARDLDYWETEHAKRWWYNSEEWAWDPLVGELSSLGVSTKSFTEEGFSQRKGVIKIINMPAFIRWAKSPPAFTLVFKDLSTNDAGLSDAYKRITDRR